MEKRIELEKRRRPPAEVYDLNLDNCRSTSIEGLSEKFINLKTLSLIGVGLTSLKGFPKLPKLRKLELSDNRISGGFQILADCESLSILNLSNNKIKDMDTIEPLKELKQLKSLDLYRNEITQTEQYREKVFTLLPELTYLDSVDRNGKEVDDSDLDEDESDIKELNGKEEDDDDVGDSEDDLGEEEEDEDGEEEEDEADGGGDGEQQGEGEGEEGEGAEDDDDDKGSLELDSSSDEEEGAALPLTLKDIYRDTLEGESDGEDYEEEEDESEDDDDGFVAGKSFPSDSDSDEEPGTAATTTETPEKRGVKRQHEGDDSDVSD